MTRKTNKEEQRMALPNSETHYRFSIENSMQLPRVHKQNRGPACRAASIRHFNILSEFLQIKMTAMEQDIIKSTTGKQWRETKRTKIKRKSTFVRGGVGGRTILDEVLLGSFVSKDSPQTELGRTSRSEAENCSFTDWHNQRMDVGLPERLEKDRGKSCKKKEPQGKTYQNMSVNSDQILD